MKLPNKGKKLVGNYNDHMKMCMHPTVFILTYFRYLTIQTAFDETI